MPGIRGAARREVAAAHSRPCSAKTRPYAYLSHARGSHRCASPAACGSFPVVDCPANLTPCWPPAPRKYGLDHDGLWFVCARHRLALAIPSLLVAGALDVVHCVQYHPGIAHIAALLPRCSHWPSLATDWPLKSCPADAGAFHQPAAQRAPAPSAASTEGARHRARRCRSHVRTQPPPPPGPGHRLSVGGSARSKAAAEPVIA